MGLDRRGFLKVSGLTALAAAGGKGVDTLARGGVTAHAAGGGAPENDAKQRWAMVVDVRRCRTAGCNSECQTSCHRDHHVPKFDRPKDEIKWIWREEFRHTFHEHAHAHTLEALAHFELPVLCNHCDNPPCVRVCPTQSTWKRKDDGVVMMDWHRCIGCRYCVVACPYGSRSFNWKDPRAQVDKQVKAEFQSFKDSLKSLGESAQKRRLDEKKREILGRLPRRERGVVEKCTFCAERMAKDDTGRFEFAPGRGPSCVQACPAKALVFGDLEDAGSGVRKVLGRDFAIRRKPELGTRPEVYYINIT